MIGMVAVMAVEMLGHAVYPPAAGLDPSTPEAMARYVAAMPVGALLFVVAGWFSGALAGGWVAATVGRWSAAAWVIAALIAIAGIYNATQIPAPLWMNVATVLAPALGGLAAHVLAKRRRVA